MFGKNTCVFVLFNDNQMLCNFMEDNKLLSESVIICHR